VGEEGQVLGADRDAIPLAAVRAVLPNAGALVAMTPH
jgi:hypothetical protein